MKKNILEKKNIEPIFGKVYEGDKIKKNFWLYYFKKNLMRPKEKLAKK